MWCGILPYRLQRVLQRWNNHEIVERSHQQTVASAALGWWAKHQCPHHQNSYEQLPAFSQANSIYKCETTEDLIKFYHVCLLFSVKSTWLKAINAGYFKGWPGVIAKRVQKYIKIISETEKGHMNKVSQGQRSSNKPPQDDPMETQAQTPTNKKTPHLHDRGWGNGKNLQRPD